MRSIILIFLIAQAQPGFTLDIPPAGTISIYGIASNFSVFDLPSQGAAAHGNFETAIPREIWGFIINANPENACNKITPPPFTYLEDYDDKYDDDIELKGKEPTVWILIANNLGCSSQRKIDIAVKAGFNVIIISNTGSNETEILGNKDKDLVLMSIPTYSVGDYSAILLRNEFNYTKGFYAKITTPSSIYKLIIAIVIWTAFAAACLIILIGICKPLCQCWAEPYIRAYIKARKQVLLIKALAALPTVEWMHELQLDHNLETCVICLEHFVRGDSLRILSCLHGFHTKCIDVWLIKVRRFCPICKDRFKYSEIWDDCSESDISEGNYITNASSQTVLVLPQPQISRDSQIPSTSHNGGQYEDNGIMENRWFNTTDGLSSTSSSLTSIDYSLYYSAEINDLNRFNRPSTSAVMITTVACIEQQSNSLRDDHQWYSVEIDPEKPLTPNTNTNVSE